MLTERDRCRVTFTQPDVLRNTLTCTRVNSQSQWIQRATVQKLCSRVTMGTTYRPSHPPTHPPTPHLISVCVRVWWRLFSFGVWSRLCGRTGKELLAEPSSSTEALTSLNRWTQSLKERNQHRATTRQTTVVLYRRTAAAAAQVCEG